MDEIFDSTRYELTFTNSDSYLKANINKRDRAGPPFNFLDELYDRCRKLNLSRVLVVSQLGPLKIQQAFKYIRRNKCVDGVIIKRLGWVENHHSSSIAVDLISVMIEKISMDNVRFFKKEDPAVQWLTQGTGES